MIRLAFLIYVFCAGAAFAQEGKNDCITTTFQGPEYASILYRNSCSEPIVAKVCSKFFIAELWNALKGDILGGKWRCAGARSIGANSHIDLRIAAVEQSSVGRKAMAETSYRIFTCDTPYIPLIQDTDRGLYECYLDPADRANSWDPQEYERLTKEKILAYDDETVMGYAARELDCNPDVSHEIAGVFPDTKMVAEDVIAELRYIHLGITIHSNSNWCRLRGDRDSTYVKFKFNAFIGQQKLFVLNYATNDTWRFNDHEQMRTTINSVLEKTGYLWDECDGDYPNKLSGFFHKKQKNQVTVDEVIEDLRRAHATDELLKARIRRCLKSNSLAKRATFQYTLLGHQNQGGTILKLAYETGGLHKSPDVEMLRSEIKQGLSDSGYLAN